MASTPVDIPIGAIVDVSLGRGVVRFSGTTSFSVGKWVGIELSEPVGKNDGTVQGTAYFSCPPKCGVFVKPSQVKIVQDSSSSGPVSTTPTFSLSSILMTSYSQVRNLWPGRLSATQERPVLALRAPHPLVLFPLLPRVQQAHLRLGLVRVHAVQDSPLLLLLSEVQFWLLTSKVL